VNSFCITNTSALYHCKPQGVLEDGSVHYRRSYFNANLSFTCCKLFPQTSLWRPYHDGITTRTVGEETSLANSKKLSHGGVIICLVCVSCRIMFMFVCHGDMTLHACWTGRIACHSYESRSWSFCHANWNVPQHKEAKWWMHRMPLSRTALGPTQTPIQWVQESLSVGVKRPGREADHSPPSSAEVK
jgi:hypothetical protein